MPGVASVQNAARTNDRRDSRLRRVLGLLLTGADHTAGPEPGATSRASVSAPTGRGSRSSRAPAAGRRWRSATRRVR
jgi:hypothetical protein